MCVTKEPMEEIDCKWLIVRADQVEVVDDYRTWSDMSKRLFKLVFNVLKMAIQEVDLFGAKCVSLRGSVARVSAEAGGDSAGPSGELPALPGLKRLRLGDVRRFRGIKQLSKRVHRIGKRL